MTCSCSDSELRVSADLLSALQLLPQSLYPENGFSGLSDLGELIDACPSFPSEEIQAAQHYLNALSDSLNMCEQSLCEYIQCILFRLTVTAWKTLDSFVFK